MPHTENHKDSKLDFVYDLQKEIPRWVTHGLIDSEQSKNILEYYKVTADTLKTGRTYARLVTILATFGAILLGLGVILFFANNWDELSFYFKFALVIVLLLGANAIAYFLKYRKRYERIGTGVFGLASIWFGASIVLIAQNYHFDFDNPDYLIWCFAGIFPIAYLIKSRLVLIFATALGTIWLGWRFGEVFHEDLAAVLLLSGAISFGTILYVIGILHNRLVKTQLFGNTYILFSFIISISALYFLSFADIHEDLESVLPNHLLAILPVIIGTIIFSSLTVLIIRLKEYDLAKWSSDKFELILLITIHLLSYVVILHPNIGEYFYFVLFNLVIIGASAAFILIGLSGRRSGIVNMGVCLFALIVITRYIDLFMGMLPTSLFFIGGGLVLFVGGFILEKYRRKLLNNFSTMEPME